MKLTVTDGILIAVVVVLAILIMLNMRKDKDAAANNASLAAVNNSGALLNAAPVVIPNAGTAGNVVEGMASMKGMIPEGMASMKGMIKNNSGNSSSNGQVNYENAAQEKLRENSEYFAVCGNGNETHEILDCICGDKPDVSFAKFDYGAPNMDYKEYVSSQAVDDKVIENHLQFVRDRKGLGPEGEFITGRTYSPDSHDSYDPTPWVGIRGRPQYVQQCNPTQVPDVDTNLYKGHRPYCFWT